MKQTVCIIAIFLLTASVAYTQDFIFSSVNVQNGLSDNQVRYIIQLPDGRMVFKTSGNINIYNGTDFKYVHQHQQQAYLLAGYQGFYRIYLSSDSLLWIKDYQKLMCLDLRIEKYLQNLDTFFKKIGFTDPIDDLFMDSRKQIWIRSGNQLSLKDHSLSLNLPVNAGILQDLSIVKQFLYLFYNTGTIVCYDLNTKKKQYSVKAYPSQRQSVFGNTSLVVEGKNGFYQLRNGTKGGFFFFNIKQRIWKKILETNYQLNTIVVDKDGIASISCARGIWIIDVEGGTNRYLPALNKIDGHTINTEISTLFYDKQGGLWLGTLNQGLLYYHPSRFSFSHVGRPYFFGDSTRDIVVQSFAEDEDENIYLDCQTQYFRYSARKDKRISLEELPISAVPESIIKIFTKNSFSAGRSNYGTGELIDKRGWRWTGTADGLKVFDPNSQKERTFYTSDGLSNNFIHAILQDRHNSIWITTSYGLNKVHVDSSSSNIKFTNFGPEAGTLGEEYADCSAFEASDGRLYFGGINGFTILEPKRLSPERLPTQPLFSNLFLKSEKIEIGRDYGGRVILKNSAAYTKQLELSYDQNFVAFEFAALNYRNSAQTYYRYKLEGIDKDWREIVAKGNSGKIDNNGLLTISYTNLPHGKYKLKVMSSSTDYNWKVPATVLQITIHAPWWKTTLAIMLFIFLGISLLVAIVSIYMRNSRKRMQQKHREEILLLRIRNLIEQQNVTQDGKESFPASAIEINESETSQKQNQVDSEFLAKALLHVENNLQVPNYSVEQLSRDLHMDRTGLYRKLYALMEKSPSLFIRNVRLEKAAVLILEGRLSISEITEKVGFSSSSYLSKCFQERYGCRPTEYRAKGKKST